MTAERTLDRLLPQALALAFGVTALFAGLAGIVADVMYGRPSPTSGIGILLMFPLVLFAAVVGFAAGHFIGMALRSRKLTPHVPMKPYRIVMALGLGVATVIGAVLGGRPVLRHERLFQPRVIVDAAGIERQEGAAESCSAPQPAAIACDLSTGQTTHTFVWNGRDVTVGCTREGRITVVDPSNAVTASADLSDFEYVRQVRAAVARQTDGRQSLALLAQLRARGRRAMFLIFNADGRVIFQEMLRQSEQSMTPPLSVCRMDTGDALIVDAGEPVTYRMK